MLRKYAPSVSNNNLSQFIGAFGELRRLVDEGTITYPYSTRELVNILRHLEVMGESEHIDFENNVVDVFLTRRFPMKGHLELFRTCLILILTIRRQEIFYETSCRNMGFQLD